MLQTIAKGLGRFNSAALSLEASQKSLCNVVEMNETKSQIKHLIAAANDKPKRFYAKVDELFPQIDDDIPSKIAAKVLLYSRRVLIDVIAETFGGKDDRSKKCLDQYLQRQDYTANHVQDSLRGFMQTFRMAGIDSQVVFRILEHFSKVYYSHDSLHTFVSQEEAYEFTYLIIVLQTC